MKVLQVLAGATHGGAETAFVDTCIALSEDGVEVEVATRPNPIRVPRLREHGINVHELPFGGKFDVFTTLKMKKIIRAFEPDIVQTWMSRAADKTPAWSPSMGIKRYGVLARLGGYYNIKYFKSCDYFMAITPDIRKYLIDKGVSADRVRHINNLAEVEEDVRSVNRGDFGTPDDSILLLALGRLHQSKAFDTLIKAVAAVPKVHLWIAGEGPDRQKLAGLIETMRVGERIKLLGWRDDRSALFNAADICVFPSRYEPFGTVFVQAWARHTPLITSDASGPKQFVRHGEDGLIVPIDNVAAFSSSIERLAGDAALRERLAENGYQRYLDDFKKEQTLAAYKGYYEEIVAALRSDEAKQAVS